MHGVAAPPCMRELAMLCSGDLSCGNCICTLGARQAGLVVQTVAAAAAAAMLVGECRGSGEQHVVAGGSCMHVS